MKIAGGQDVSADPKDFSLEDLLLIRRALGKLLWSQEYIGVDMEKRDGVVALLGRVTKAIRREGGQ